MALTLPGTATSAQVWSGIPASIVSALEALGVDVTTVDARTKVIPERCVRGAIALGFVAGRPRARSLAEARIAASLSPELGAARTLSLLRHSTVLASVDGIVQMDSSYLLPRASAPYVTYEDMTVPQAVRAGYPIGTILTRRRLLRRIDIQRRMYSGASACCFTSRWAATSAVEDFGIDARKVHVVGVGANHVVSQTEREWYPPRFLFIGKDWERKSGDAVVRVFKRVREEHPDARLDLVGQVPALRVPGVTAHGMLALDNPVHRERIVRLLQLATCFVMPSRHEPSALAYVEAAHAGLPSIVSTAGGSPELVGLGGVGVAPGDDEALFAAMTVLCDPGRARATGSQASAHAKLYTWDAVAARLLRALSPSVPLEGNSARFL